MQFVYKPEGAEPRKWEFDPARLMSPEIEAIERHTGLEFGSWAVAVGKGSVLAIHGLLYVLLKRNNPTLKWDEVQFCMAEIDFEMSESEQELLVGELTHKAHMGTISDDERRVLEQLESMGVDARDGEPGKD